MFCLDLEESGIWHFIGSNNIRVKFTKQFLYNFGSWLTHGIRWNKEVVLSVSNGDDLVVDYQYITHSWKDEILNCLNTDGTTT